MPDFYNNEIVIYRTAGRLARIDRRKRAAMMSEANTAELVKAVEREGKSREHWPMKQATGSSR
jgi:hypothetical protein